MKNQALEFSSLSYQIALQRTSSSRPWNSPLKHGHALSACAIPLYGFPKQHRRGVVPPVSWVYNSSGLYPALIKRAVLTGGIMTKGLKLWNDLAFEFLRELRAMSPEQLKKFWGTRSDRTASYLGKKDGILPRIAMKMGMRFKAEHMRFDGEFYREGDDGFPEVFVEVENKATDIARSELENLCYLRAPLKLVITVSMGPEQDKALKSQWLKDVKDCQQKWLKESPEVVYGFIIGEVKWEDTDQGKRKGLKFHLFAASPDGEIVVKERDEVVGWFS
jgi:hypothetical protein